MRANSLREVYGKVRDEFLRECTGCAVCVEVCPIYPMTSWEGLSPAQLHAERLAMLRSDVTDAAHKFTFACSNCGACRDSCPDGLDPFRLTQVLRWASREAGHPPPENAGAKHPDHPDSLARVSIALQTKPGEARWLDAVPENPPPADTVLFLGCNVLAMPDKVNALLDVFDAMGLDIPAVSGTKLCCGAYAMLGGDVDQVDDLARTMIAELARYRPTRVIYWCNGCHIKAEQDAPLFMDVPFENQHVTRFLSERVERMKFQRPLERKVTVHDACGLGRILGEYEPVRELLASIPGLELVEMSKNRAEAPCCGATTGIAAPELARSLGRSALSAVVATGAATLVTTCQGCQRRFAPFEPGYPFTVETYVDVLAEALGIVHEDRFKRFVQYHDPERVIAETDEAIAASGYERSHLEELVRFYFR